MVVEAFLVVGSAERLSGWWWGSVSVPLPVVWLGGGDRGADDGCKASWDLLQAWA